jgi:hypothetical protein
MGYNGNHQQREVVPIMKKILAAIKDKTNWGSFITLALALTGAVVSFVITREVLSLAVGLIAAELFLLVVVHLEDIQGALKRVESREPRGAQLKKRDDSLFGQMITASKEEIFFCGCDLMRLTPQRGNLLSLPDKVHVRMLVMDIDNDAVSNSYKATFGRTPDMPSLTHLNWVLSRKNFEIRTVDFPLTVFVSAKDMHTATGNIQVSFRYFGEFGQSSPCVDLSPADTEWYDFYKNQIELLWARGTPWQP